MCYDPFEHRPTSREIIAAWVVCLGIVGLGLALTLGHGAAQSAAAPNPSTMAGVRLPGVRPAAADPSPLLGSRLQPSEPMAPHRASPA